MVISEKPLQKYSNLTACGHLGDDDDDGGDGGGGERQRPLALATQWVPQNRKRVQVRAEAFSLVALLLLAKGANGSLARSS